MIRVFLVDDHTVIRQGMASLLSALPFVNIVGQAASAEAAVQAIGADVDVVIADLRLPAQDGGWLTSQLKAAGPRPAVLVVSMYEDRASVNSALRAGALGYLPKSATRDELALAIQVVHQGNCYLHRSVSGFAVAALAAAAEPTVPVTLREETILEYVRKGLSNKEIAVQTSLSLPMVKKHLHVLYRKFDVPDRSQLIAVLHESWGGDPPPGRQAGF
ncbi:MAG TPA: response regulator transcription factor [Candidatus Xenobia bacterium]|jgi:DNA-binding NarL/FixJ family response regulator